jgi:hypothetical protein
MQVMGRECHGSVMLVYGEQGYRARFSIFVQYLRAQPKDACGLAG